VYSIAAEGWLDLKHGRGAVVIEREQVTATRSQIAEFRDRIRQIAAQMQASGIPPSRVAQELRLVAEAFSK
jgi:DNA-binding GntR family transcriptional regulator